MVDELILDRFRLEERLGSGGFGTVYRAWDERLHRPVAVKVIDAGAASGRRVLREAQAAARLNHRGIVTLYELGSDRGRAYLVSELVDGQTLAELDRAGSLSDRDVAEVGADLCEALSHAHLSGVIHRDIKPQNALVSAASGRAKLMDFGIARLTDGPGLTATGDVVGTIAYMAPEQAEGGEVGPAADVYALALTLYECWAGANPVLRGSPAATARAIGSPIRPLADPRPDLPPALTETVDACLRRDSRDRPGTQQLEAALEDAAPLLDPEPAVPRPRRRLRAGFDLLTHPALARALAAIGIAALSLAGLIWAGVAAPVWAYVLPLIAGVLALRLPRLGFATAAAGLVAWLSSAAELPGAALVVVLLTVPIAVSLPRTGRLWSLPALAPVLGAVGLGPLFCALAGLSGTVVRRVALAVLGYLWLVVAEAVVGTNLLIGGVDPVAAGWQRSIGAAGSDLLLPLVSGTVLLGALVWAAAALVFGMVVRGRLAVLELLAVLVWAAALLALHRLLAPAGAEAMLPPAWLAAAILVVVAGALAYRARSFPVEWAPGYGTRGSPQPEPPAQPPVAASVPSPSVPAGSPQSSPNRLASPALLGADGGGASLS